MGARAKLACVFWAVALSGPALGNPAPSQGEVLQPSSKWILDASERRCRLVRSFGTGDDAVTIGFDHVPTQDVYSLSFAGHFAWKMAGPLAEVRLQLQPSGKEIKAEAGLLESGSGRVAKLWRIDEGFVRQLAESDTLVFLSGAGFSLQLKPAPTLLATLSHCEDGLLASWGIDPAVLHALRERPRPKNDPGNWVTVDDYPSDALRARALGETVVGYRVGLDGRVHDCRTLASAGNRSLDAQTCAVLERRARYTPAVDADGRPAEADLVNIVHWALP